METHFYQPTSGCAGTDQWHRNCRRLLCSLAVMTLLGGGIASAQVADRLYIGDRGDNTVKSFAASDGTSQGTFVKKTANASLRGPGGLVFQADGKLVVSDQNATTSVSGEIDLYDNNGNPLPALVKKTDPDAPAVPRGVILWHDSASNQDYLFVADFSASTKQNSHKLPEPGRVLKYARDGRLVGTLLSDLALMRAGANPAAEFHPRGLVIGPDGLLYVSSLPNPDVALIGSGGQVLRFHPDTGDFKDVYIDRAGGIGDLNRPEGLAFGPDGNLYLTSFRQNVLAGDPVDNDKIMVFQGPANTTAGQAPALVRKIDLDEIGAARTYAQALLFGPGGALFLPITTTGEVRRCDLSQSTNPCATIFVPAGTLINPWYLTFGKTDPATLAYPPEGGPNLAKCFCQDNSAHDVCTPVVCDTGAAQDAICGPICASHGGVFATGCLLSDPICGGAQSSLPRQLLLQP